DFIDMVLESNRDLVLRRLTEALARDRTRHQVSEVTSLGLVQLTRKRLGTGLVEAFSTTCTHCNGRGIVLHGDPVDSTSGTGRKADGGGRRGKRGKRGSKADDVEVAKVPPHPAGEHPMFKAMAAATGRHSDDEDETSGEATDTKPEESDGQAQDSAAEAVAESEHLRTAVIEAGEEDIDDLEDEYEDSDEDSDDSDDDDDVELDPDDDEAIEDDIEVIGASDEDSDEDSDDDSDEDDDYDDSDEDDSEESDEDDSDSDDEDEPDESPAAVTAPEPAAPPPVSTGGRHRRRAAARPAGPPSVGS
ncbi:ribonuclease E/G, partial [Mycolicibacterium phlei]|uniref:ribonuclease E/G n=1 Tax=Mycolicibacterium phlei TaxID=1771 RepID=UPI0037C788BA